LFAVVLILLLLLIVGFEKLVCFEEVDVCVDDLVVFLWDYEEY